MKIPPGRLSPEALQEIVEEFVTRDGTDHSEFSRRVLDVLKQLELGSVELYFDELTRTCNIVTASPK
ncbi:YheU family protein [Mariniblastus sp.]|jgi:hypothetical protein|nr:YheU family protein [Mariniblastus sp.]MDB4757038.1 YheU family protein [Mariniblastus sp.]